MKSFNVKNLKIARVSFSTMSMLLCAAMISSCGSPNDRSKTSDTTVTNTGGGSGQPDGQVLDGVPNNGTNTNAQGAPATTGTPSNLQQTNPQNSELPAPTENKNASGEQAAPVGRVTTSPSSETKKDKAAEKKATENKSNPKFEESAAIKTGGKTGDLFYTAAGDDGIMELFKKNSTTVSKDQQNMNATLAKAIAGAKLKKSGTEMNLDLSIDEEGTLKLYRLKASPNGNRLKLTALSIGGDLEFQGGFVKCLDDSCDNAYTKIKMSGAYTRIIFRTSVMNNHFGLQDKAADTKYDLWKKYILNTVQGLDTTAKIASVKASSYEVLNGKSAMGTQLLTEDNESVSLSFPLVAAETGTEVNQATARTADLSVNYNLPSSAGRLSNLSAAMVETRLVNNNGKGQIRLKMIFANGAGIWMTLTRQETQTLKAADIEAFDAAIKF